MYKVLALSMLVACGGGLKDDRFATGSSTAVAARGYDAVLAVNVDEGTVSRLDRESGRVQQIEVGSEPTRIARVGDEYWVTLRGERAVAVLGEDGGKLELLDVFPAGVEPHGIVSTENGKRVYVAGSLTDEVIEFDGKTREELRRFDVQDEPRWLALHPSDKALFVASVRNGTLSRIDLREGTVERMELPETSRETRDGHVGLTPRFTGDPAITPDGVTVALPVFFVDNETPVDTPENEEEPVTSGYGSSGLGVSRLNPAVVTYELGSSGQPDGPGEAVFLATMPSSQAVFDERGTDFGDNGMAIVRSYPSSVTAAPNGKEFLVTMEGSDTIVVVRNRPFDFDNKGETVVDMTEPDMPGMDFDPFVTPEDAGMVTYPMAAITTAAGPRGVVFVDEEQALVHSFLDRTLQEVDYESVHDVLRDTEEGDFFGTAGFQAGTPLILAESALPAEVEEGRRLFFSAIDSRMSAFGSGVSCATCHTDGRNDGLTWTLQGQPRQTPSLAGPVNETAPVTWADDVASVADEAMLTTSLRMGGDGLQRQTADLVEAYVAWSRYPDSPRAGDDGPLVQLGKEVFERADVGCASCHSGKLYTDNASHDILGALPTQTPTLRGISASAPYLHDGSAPDLRSVVLMARDGSMGDTSSLSDHEVDALVAYLESL